MPNLLELTKINYRNYTIYLGFFVAKWIFNKNKGREYENV